MAVGRVGRLLSVPAGLLARMRWLFLAFGLFNVVGLMAQIVVSSRMPTPLRGAAVVSLAVLGAWWVRGYRRERFPAAGLPAEALAFALTALAIGSSAYAAFGLLYTGVNFRALYGTWRQAAAFVGTALVAFFAAVLIGPALGQTSDVGDYVQQVPGVPVLGACAYIIASTLRAGERAQRREKVLVEAGTALSRAADRSTLYATAVDAARRLLDGLPGARVGLGLDTAEGHEIIATSGAGWQDLVGTRLSPEALPEPMRAALRRGSPAFGRPRPGTPPSPDTPLEPADPADGTTVIVPLRNREGHQGALVVAGDGPVPTEAVASLETLGVQLALSLENVSLTEDLSRRAYTDPLTGLANRALLLDRLAQAIGRAQRAGDRAGSALALLLIDLDGFKGVNDSLGHATGDRLLVAVAERLAACIRPADTAARLGGDEFAILLDGLDGPGEAQRAATRILAALGVPLLLEDATVPTAGSIGVAVWAGHADAEALLRDADAAMYAAKSGGRNRFSVFEPSMRTEDDRRRAREAELRRALESGDLVTAYQPVVALADGGLAGVEALVRWRRPGHGTEGPDTFLPLAERSGLIVPIGAQVLEGACRTLRAWQDELGPAAPAAVTVNLSPRQLAQTTLVEQITGLLTASGLDPRSLELELSGRSVLDGAARARLLALADLGVRLAIDDLGGAWTPVDLLTALPIGTLKVDRSLVARLERGGAELAVTRAVMRVGADLGLRTVAEGVETAAQLEAVRALGAGFGQGAYFAPPLTAEALGRDLAEGRFRTATTATPALR